LSLADSQEAAFDSSDHNGDPSLDEISVRSDGDGDEAYRDYLYNIREEELPQAPITSSDHKLRSQAPIYDIRL
jgi:hypothetical protein